MSIDLDFAPDVRTAKATPPNKFWRALWYNPHEWEGHVSGYTDAGYNCVPTISIDACNIVAGPICPTAELAEEAAKTYFKQNLYILFCPHVTYEPIKTNDKGEPISD